MAKRESFVEHFHCPRCAKTGSSEWEENENPMHAQGRLDRELKLLSDGFTSVENQSSSGDPEIECKKCKVKVSIGSA
jgi:hypothetical protein